MSVKPSDYPESLPVEVRQETQGGKRTINRRRTSGNERRRSYAAIQAHTAGFRSTAVRSLSAFSSEASESESVRSSIRSSVSSLSRAHSYRKSSSTPVRYSTQRKSELPSIADEDRGSDISNVSASSARSAFRTALGIENAPAPQEDYSGDLLDTALELMQEKCEYLRAIERMLLPLLDSIIGTGRGMDSVLKQNLLDTHEWALRQFDGGAVSLPGSSRHDIRLAGWLYKLGRSGTKMQRRWVELGGQTLNYFSDSMQLKGSLDLEFCMCRPLTQRSNSKGERLFSFELSATQGRTIRKINMKHSKEKKSYKFFTGSEQEQCLWVAALQSAIDQPELARVRRAKQLFAEVGNDFQAYLDRLKDIRASGKPLCIACDWLHQQVLQESASRNGLQLDGPIWDDRHEAKDLQQVYKDIIRDTVMVDGREFVCKHGSVIVKYLFHRIFQGFCEMNQLNPDALTKEKRHWIIRGALAYSRGVLLASCRTVSGGDTYDAVNFLFGNEAHAVVCPDADFMAPVRISVVAKADQAFGGESVAGEEREYPEKSAEISQSNLNRSFEEMHMNYGNKSTVESLRARFAAPGQNVTKKKNKSYSVQKSVSSSMSTHSVISMGNGVQGLSMSTAEYESNRATEFLKTKSWPRVAVIVQSQFRVMAADPMSVDEPVIASVATTFLRDFAWGKHTYCKPATVNLTVLPVTPDVNENQRMSTRGTELFQSVDVSEL